MRNPHTSGKNVDGDQQPSRPNRKNHTNGKRKMQQSTTMPITVTGAAAAVAPYEAQSNHNFQAVQQNNMFQINNGASQRSHSKGGVNGRQSRSIKHKSAKVQIPMHISAVNNGSTPVRTNVHSRPATNQANVVSDPEYQIKMVDNGKYQQEQREHSLQVDSQMKMTQPDLVNAYTPGQVPRSSSKMNQKHRKLSRQPSAVAARDSQTKSPSNKDKLVSLGSSNDQNQTLNLRQVGKGGQVQQQILQQQLVCMSTSGFDVQQMINKNSFGSQPDFILTAQHSGNQGGNGGGGAYEIKPLNNNNQTQAVGNQVIPVNARASNQAQGNGNDIPNIFNQEKQARSFNMRTTPQKFTSKMDQKFSASGKFFNASSGVELSPTKNNKFTQNSQQNVAQVQQSMELSRKQQMLHQQLQQQQNFKQHLQSVHLEIKGSTATTVPTSSHGYAGHSTTVTQANNHSGSGFGGPKSISNVPQQQIATNLTSSVPLQRASSPQNTAGQKQSTSQAQSIFVHHPSSLSGHQLEQEKSPSMSNHTNKMILAPHSQDVAAQLGLLQNSKSPFKQKQSQKLLRGQTNTSQTKQTGITSSQLNSPVVVIRKKHSAKNSLRKQSAKKTNAAAQSSNVYNSGGPAAMRNDISNFQMLAQKSIGGGQAQNTYPMSVNQAASSGQKSLKTQVSQSKIKPSPDQLQKHLLVESSQQDMRSQNTFNAGNPFNIVSSEGHSQQTNMSGLLNMSKQRAYTQEADHQKPDASSQNMTTNTQSIINTILPRELRLTDQAHQRSDSQHANQVNRPTYNSSTSASGQFTAGQAFNKKTSHSFPSSETVGSFQNSGKQIIQGQQTLYTQQQKQQQQQLLPAGGKMTDMANSVSTNKTLPLSVFEMQFYQGDFLPQQMGGQGSFQGGKVGLGSVPTGSKFIGPQLTNQLKLAASGQILPQQFLTKNGIQTASVGSMLKNGANYNDLSHQQQIERQKVNYVALQNFHQQWISSHGNSSNSNYQNLSSQFQPHHQQQFQVLQRNNVNFNAYSNGSQQNLTLAQTLQSNTKANTSPQKASVKHHGLVTNSSQMSQPVSQQMHQHNKLVGPALLQQQMINVAQCQGHMQQQYGGPVQVNGRQMQMPANSFVHTMPQNFSQLSQLQQANSQQQRLANSSEMQHAYMSQDLSELLQLQMQQSAPDQFSQQLYAMQLQSQTQAAQQQERLLKRRDGNTMFKRVVSKIPFENAYVEDCYKFIIGYGNNSHLIRNALKQRNWWIEIQPVHSMFNFKWNPTSDGIKFARLGHQDFGKREQGTMGQKLKDKDGKNKEVEPVQDKINLQMVNHMEYHQLLTEKYNLLMVMQKFCDTHKENTFDLMPITFFVEIPDASRDQLVTQALSQFETLWRSLEANKDKLTKLQETLIRQLHQRKELEEQETTATAAGGKSNNQALQDKIQRLESVTGTSLSQPTNSGKITKFKAFNFEKRTSQKYTMPLCHFDSYNLWLIKPTHLNRGRGIHVFNDLDTLHKLIKQYCTGREEAPKKNKDKESQPKEAADKDVDGENGDQTQAGFDSEQEDQTPMTKTTSPSKKQTSNKIKHNTFIIQKYIEKPLLIYKRKFDIRVWVILTQDQDLYFFKEGYLRTSSTEFGIDLQNIDNAFVHLTNNAVQKHAENYGDHEDGNMLSFPQFQEYIDQYYPESGVSVYNHLVPQMHEVILKTFNAVRKTIDPNRRKHCFELFGYDFILDEEFNQWLIEVNTNPCLEESSDLLKRLLPRMIDDMLKLTVDVVFPKNGIKRRRDFTNKKKGNGSPQKISKKDSDIRDSSPVKRVSTANKKSVQLQSAEEQNQVKDRGGQTTDTEQASNSKERRAVSRQKTYSTDANSVEPTNKLAKPNSDREGGDFTSQAGFSQSLPDSDMGGADGAEKANETTSPLTTIKEKLGRGRCNPVPGYIDSENMWEKLGNLEKDLNSNVTRHANKKSVYTVQVQDKVFKLRKNPAYTGPLNLPVLQPDPSEILAKQEAGEIAEENDNGDEAIGDSNEVKNTGDEDGQ